MTDKFGSCPIVFVDEKKQKEWDSLDENTKKFVKSNIHAAMKELTQKLQIEMLCHLYNDLSKRIDDLEKKK